RFSSGHRWRRSLRKGGPTFVAALEKRIENENTYRAGPSRDPKHEWGYVQQSSSNSPEEKYLKNGFQGDIYGILRPIHRGIPEFV
ncbi:hypothetical protein, partial [Staphylococcus shinii]|uniref:hypothetical protein n=1 Tax=Staphylococcus shinii TaxID=2912228 RepID=UPI003F517045